MNLLKYLTKSKTVEKSVSGYDPSCNSNYWYNNAYFTDAYYQCASALYTGVSTIANTIADYEYQVVNESTNEVITGTQTNEWLKILNNPNPYDSKEVFMQKSTSSYLLDGQIFMFVEMGVLTGKVSKMIPVISRYITLSNDSTVDGYPKSYQMTEYNPGTYFYEFDKKQNIVKYVNSQDVNKILIPIKAFSPNGNNCYPVSAVDAVMSELRQFVEGNVHNTSLLKNGTSMGAILNFEGELTKDQFKRIKKQLRDGFQGAKNAGQPILAEGNLKGVQNLTLSNRDMEYTQLREINEKAIYKVLNLPLPMFLDKSMTMDNMKQAKELLHEQTCIPLINFMLGEISRVVLPIGFRFIVNEFEISVLVNKKLAQNTEISKGGYLTTNELRSRAGYPPIAGGDILVDQSSSGGVDDSETDTTKQQEHDNYYSNLMQENGIDKNEAEAIVKKARH